MDFRRVQLSASLRNWFSHDSLAMPSADSQLKEVLANALAIASPEERKAYLRKTYAHDERRLREIETLLEAHMLPAGTPGSAVHAGGTPPSVPASLELTDRELGPYKIREKIGEGAMGIVYVAEQREPVYRKVALKVIKPGMDSRDVIARFEVERETLGLMDHPHIAKVLDSGTTDTGSPYFVMELVRGIPITVYCNRHALTIRERLQLFVKVCAAVQHAHLKGIIHRDLKPTNVLVEQHDTAHVPKVIDFGIAKALDRPLTEQTVYTRFAAVIGTPHYMSPEQTQLSGLDVDTRSDVYSLGVMLYELLVGTLPHEDDKLEETGLDELFRRAREVDPPRPSQRLDALARQPNASLPPHLQANPREIARFMRRELDWIVMKALEQDRTRRYESASQLAEDLRNHLSGKPVRACPPSLSYRVSKIVKRHWGLLTAAALVLLTAVAGTGVSLWYASQAHSLADQAQSATLVAEQHAREADEATRETRSLLYATDMRLASRLLMQGDYSNFSELLEQYAGIDSSSEEDPRGFEWWHLRQYGIAESELLAARDEQGCLIRFSPDGQSLVVGWSDGTIEIRNSETGGPIATFRGHGDFVNGCDFHPDGKTLATVADDGTVRIWDLDRQRQIREIQACEGHAHRVFFLADGQSLVSSGEEGRVRFWDARTGDPLGEIAGFSEGRHSGVERRFDCSPQRDRGVIADASGKARVYDLRTRKELTPLKGLGDDYLRCLRFSRDGKLIAGGTDQKQVIVWNAGSGELLLRFSGHYDQIFDLAFHPAGRLLTSCDRGGIVRAWPLNGIGEGERESEGSDREIEFADDRPDARRPLPATADRWPEVFRAHTDRVLALDFSPDGSRLVTGSRDNTVLSWRGVERQSQTTIETPAPRQVKFLNGGADILIAGEKQLTLWNRTAGELRRLGEYPETVDSLRVAPAGNTFVTTHVNGWLRLWDATSYQLKSEQQIPGTNFDCTSISADATFLVSSDSMNDVTNLWIISSEGISEPRTTFPGFDEAWLSPDARVLIMHRTNDLFAVNPHNQQQIQRFVGHLNGVFSGCFTQDGSLFVSGSSDRTVRVWETESGLPRHVIRAHDQTVRIVDISPDGRTLVSGDDGGKLVFSHLATGRVMWETQLAEGTIHDLEFSPDGELLAVVQNESLILLTAPRTPESGAFLQ